MSDYDFDIIELGDEIEYKCGTQEVSGTVTEIVMTADFIEVVVNPFSADKFPKELKIDKQDIGNDDYSISLDGWR